MTTSLLNPSNNPKIGPFIHAFILSRTLGILVTTTRVVGTPQMVFTNPIMIIHVNRTTYQPLMSLMVARRYKITSARNLKGGYRKPFSVIIGITNNRNGHFLRPNRVAFKYLDFKKNVDPDVHVKVFNFVMKENVETSKEYIINH
jgi:hypothetical protein